MIYLPYNVQENIEKNNKELKELHLALPRTLSRKVLERFMSKEDLADLHKAYESNKLTKYHKNRLGSLTLEITDSEMDLLHAYYDELETPNSEFEKRFNIPRGTISGKVRSIAIRFLFQNKDLVGF